jgi:hypothetical protein
MTTNKKLWGRDWNACLNIRNMSSEIQSRSTLDASVGCHLTEDDDVINKQPFGLQRGAGLC